jgi:rhamnose transport system permease protein
VRPSLEAAPAGGAQARTKALWSAGRVSSRLTPLAGPLLSLAVLAFVFSIVGRHFATASNVQSILFTGAVLAIAVVGQGIVVIARNLDLSIGAVMASGAYLSILLYIHVPAVGAILIPIAMAIGAALGVINGIAVAYLRIPSLVATLGTMSIFRGLLYASAGGSDLNTDQLPAWLLDFVSSTALGVPTLAVIAIGVALAVGLLLHRTQFGRTVYAVGSNPNAAMFYGLPLRQTILKTYVLGGAIAGIAGIMLAGEVGTVTVDIASGWELETLAAAVIGGMSLLGGSGSVMGAVLGALILTTIDNGLIQAGASGDWQNFIRGVVIVVAVALDLLWQHRRASRIRLLGRNQEAEEK